MKTGEKKKRKPRLITGKNGELLVASPKAWLYLLPPLIVFVLFVFYPMLAVLRTAFYEKYVYIISKGTGFGLASFKYVLNDKTFWLACKNTGILILVALPTTIILSLAIALMLNSIKRLQGFFQTLFFTPYVTSTVAIGTVFYTLFHSQHGYINYFLGLFGVDPIAWLTDSSKVIWALCIFCIWNGLAFKIVLFLAGLQKIDKKVYQAAKIDCAKPGKTLFRITLPLLSPTFWMVIIVSVIYVARTYNEVFALFTSVNSQTAGSGNCAITIAYYIYYYFFVRGEVNYAAAAAVLFLIVIMSLTILQRVISRKFVHYY